MYFTGDDIKFLVSCGVKVEEIDRINVDHVLDYMIANMMPRERIVATAQSQTDQCSTPADLSGVLVESICRLFLESN